MLTYPLQAILEIKIQRKERAEEELKKRKEELEKEKEKLIEVEKERDKAKEHHQNKLQKLRDTLDEGGVNTEEIQSQKKYLDICLDLLHQEEEKVKAQEEQVEIAEKNVDMAREEVRLRSLEVDKLDTHKEEWIKQAKMELIAEEGKQMDEIGNILYQSNKQKWG